MRSVGSVRVDFGKEVAGVGRAVAVSAYRAGQPSTSEHRCRGLSSYRDVHQKFLSLRIALFGDGDLDAVPPFSPLRVGLRQS
jgi:hypothetical protein